MKRTQTPRIIKKYFSIKVYQFGLLLPYSSVIMWDSPSGRKLDTMHFKSAVMALAWHPDEVSKLLVAQKNGVLHIVNAVSFRVRKRHFDTFKKCCVEICL